MDEATRQCPPHYALAFSDAVARYVVDRTRKEVAFRQRMTLPPVRPSPGIPPQLKAELRMIAADLAKVVCNPGE